MPGKIRLRNDLLCVAVVAAVVVIALISESGNERLEQLWTNEVTCSISSQPVVHKHLVIFQPRKQMTLKRKATSTYVSKSNAEAELAVTQSVVSGRT